MTQRLTFSKNERLSGETTVDELFRSGASFLTYPVRVVWCARSCPETPMVRVLMSVPKKKLKRAVWRNRTKRLLREAYRLHKHDLVERVVCRGLEVDVAFVWVPDGLKEFAHVERKMVDALERLGRLLDESIFSTLPDVPDPSMDPILPKP